MTVIRQHRGMWEVEGLADLALAHPVRPFVWVRATETLYRWDIDTASFVALSDGVDVIPVKASSAEVNTGTNDEKFITPAALAGSSVLDIPQNSQSANYTTVAADAGKHILHPAADDNARTFTIDSNANVPYQIGKAITFVNLINVLTVAITDDTLILAGTGAVTDVDIAANGIATAIKIAATTWMITGTGVTAGA